MKSSPIIVRSERYVFKLLDRLHDYDVGVTSGLHDDLLKKSIADVLKTMSNEGRNQFIARYIRRFLTDKAIAESHGIANVIETIKWLETDFDIYIK